MSSSSSPSTSLSSSHGSLSPPFSSVVIHLIDRQDWAELLRTAEHRELQDFGVPGPDAELYFAVQLLAAPLADEVLMAKFAWLRIPVDVKVRSVVLQFLWNLLPPLLQSNPSLYFSQSSLPPPPSLPPLLLPLVFALHSHTRRQSLRSIERTYERVSEGDARRMLGLLGEEGRREWEALLKSRGWVMEDEGWVRPKRGEEEGEVEGVGLEELRQLTKYITSLEQ